MVTPNVETPAGDTTPPHAPHPPRPHPHPQPPPTAVQYAYMFEKDKSPTKQLDALLRAIARFIALEVGSKADLQLTPPKLAAFYKSVGGDYDSLFVEVPYATISYVWQITGCQHSLQPTDDDFGAPSIPALTPRGFSRWESLEILLGPEEHVPFMQYAVKNWALKHPETGEDFPPDLPPDVFPVEADAQVDYWHKSCADRLRDAASRDTTASSTPVPDPPPEPPGPKFAHVNPRDRFNAAPPRARPAEPDYFGRPVSYTHVPGRHGGNGGTPYQREKRESRERAANRSQEGKPRRQTPPDERERERERARRRSFSDYASPSQPFPDAPRHAYAGTYLDPNGGQPQPFRRHSQPKNYSSDSSDDDLAAGSTVNPRMKRRYQPPSPPSRRFVPPSAPAPPSAVPNSTASFRPHRAEMRSDDIKRRGGGSPLGSLRNKLSETVSSILPNGLTSERPRHGSRQNSTNGPVRPRKSREQMPPSRLSRSYSDLDSDDADDDRPDEDELRRRRRLREERERYRDRGRPRDGPRDGPRDLDRERDDERDTGSRRDRPYTRRPEAPRRASSHPDADRRQEQVPFEGRQNRGREDRRKYDRRSAEEDDVSPTTTGVAGRRYPEPAYG